MQLFYDPDLTEGPHELRDVEARHAHQVLRKREGDTIDLVNGAGSWFTATITSITKRACTLDVKLVKEEAGRAAYTIDLLVAPTKNIDRFEWILEKATEIGVDTIQPIITDHSERKKIRLDRLERILESAMKQSLRAWKPVLLEPLSFSEAIEAADRQSARYLAYLGADNTPLLQHTAQPGRNVTVAIGPEGGFSPNEAEVAKANGFHFVSLGPNRLRTETAAIAAVHTLNLINW